MEGPWLTPRWKNPDLDVDQCKSSIGDAQAVEPQDPMNEWKRKEFSANGHGDLAPASGAGLFPIATQGRNLLTQLG
jgi:hypothetical protein